MREPDFSVPVPLSKLAMVRRGLLAALLSLAWLGTIMSIVLLTLIHFSAWYNALAFPLRLIVVAIPIALVMSGFVPIWDWVFKDRFDQPVVREAPPPEGGIQGS